MNKYTGYFHCYFYRITGKALQEMLTAKYKYYSKDISMYAIKENTIVDLSYYQFSEDTDSIIILDVEVGDYIIREHIDSVGLEDCNFIINSTDNFTINEKLDTSIPIPTLAKMKIEYWQDYFGESDMDCVIEVVSKEEK